MHALILAHQPLNRAVSILVLVELDEVPEIPAGFRHGLVGIVKSRRGKWHVIPFDAGDLACLAADAGGRIDQLADVVVALRLSPGFASCDGSRVGRHLFDLQYSSIAHLSALVMPSRALPGSP